MSRDGRDGARPAVHAQCSYLADTAKVHLDELVVIAGHGFVQNLRRGHYDLALDVPLADRLAAAFTQLVRAT